MTFDLQPVLRNELVELRPLRPDDFEALYEVASDPLIWEQHPEANRHEEPIFRSFFRDALDSGGALSGVSAGRGMRASDLTELGSSSQARTAAGVMRSRTHRRSGASATASAEGSRVAPKGSTPPNA